MTKKKFKFATKRNMPLVFTSAAEGDNVASVSGSRICVHVHKTKSKACGMLFWQLFKLAIEKAWEYHNNPKKDFMSEVMDLLDSSPLDDAKEADADAKSSDGDAKVRSRYCDTKSLL